MTDPARIARSSAFRDATTFCLSFLYPWRCRLFSSTFQDSRVGERRIPSGLKLGAGNLQESFLHLCTTWPREKSSSMADFRTYCKKGTSCWKFSKHGDVAVEFKRGTNRGPPRRTTRRSRNPISSRRVCGRSTQEIVIVVKMERQAVLVQSIRFYSGTGELFSRYTFCDCLFDSQFVRGAKQRVHMRRDRWYFLETAHRYPRVFRV